MLHFNVSFLRELRNQEFPEVFNEICSIKDEEQIEELYVKESLERLKASNKDLDFVMEMRIPHRLTEVLEEQCLNRKNYLVALRSRVRATLNSPIVDERASAKVLYLWMNKHRQYIYNSSIILQNRLVFNLQTEANEKEAVQTALTSLDLFNVFDSIVSLTQIIKENNDIRYAENNAAMLKAISLRNTAYFDLVKFIKALETALNLELPTKTFYAEYGKAIASRLDTYRTRHLARRTRRLNNAAEQDQPVDPIDNGVPSIPENLPDEDQQGANNGSDQMSGNQL